VEVAEEAYYHDEITALGVKEEYLHYIPHSSDSEGFLTPEVIADRVGDLKTKVYLICGPKKMMDSLREQLMEAGVPFEQIFTEDFSILKSGKDQLQLTEDDMNQEFQKKILTARPPWSPVEVRASARALPVSGRGRGERGGQLLQQPRGGRGGGRGRSGNRAPTPLPYRPT
jgi:hypothetical protein